MLGMLTCSARKTRSRGSGVVWQRHSPIDIAIRYMPYYRWLRLTWTRQAGSREKNATRLAASDAAKAVNTLEGEWYASGVLLPLPLCQLDVHYGYMP